jgi:hypothetical protein
MRNLKSPVWVCAALLFGAALIAGVAIAQEPAPPGQPDLETLQRMDPAQSHMVHPQCVPTPLPCKECLYLDTYDPSHTTNAPAGNPWVIGPVYTSAILEKGKAYIITVAGESSFWWQSVWTSAASFSGTPGTYPTYPSPGTTNGYTGFDFECLFAYPGTIGVPILFTAQTISLDGGSTWHDLPIMGGETCHASHTYQFLVEGQGKTAGFRVTDSGPGIDNSGRYRICVQCLIACEFGSVTKSDLQ